MMARKIPDERLDELLAQPDIRAGVDHAIALIWALGLKAKPDEIRDHAAGDELDPAQVDLKVALVARRLGGVQ